MADIIEDIGVFDHSNVETGSFQVTEKQDTGKLRKLYIESYGCQMNFSDSEIVASIL